MALTQEKFRKYAVFPKPQDAHTRCPAWKECFPQRRHRTWVLELRLPLDAVPLDIG